MKNGIGLKPGQSNKHCRKTF